MMDRKFYQYDFLEGLSLCCLDRRPCISEIYFSIVHCRFHCIMRMRLVCLWSNMHFFSLSLFYYSFTGGAISNMYSIMAARYKYFPEVKTKGMAAVPKLVLFTSEHVSF